MKLVILSGRSGSGKSVILQTLEDLQYYCVDNLPLLLLPDLLKQLADRPQPVAVSLDARNLAKNNIGLLSDILNKLKKDYNCTIIYLDADNNVLLRRFKETRRRHPLTSAEVSLKEAIAEENKLLSPLAQMADLKVDTTELTAAKLRQLTMQYLHQDENNSLSVLLESFGYKHGVPTEADIIFDARCLPNPYWEIKLRNLTGCDQPVIDFLEKQPLCHDMLADIHYFLAKWLPAYQAEQRKYLTIAIGCTGGQHRSVYLINKLAELLKTSRLAITVRHRDIS